MAGMVSERLWSSSISDWQLTVALEPSALGVATMELRKVWMPPLLEIPFVSTVAEVSGALSTTLQPVSRFWPAPAKVMPVKLERARRPARSWGTGSPRGCRRSRTPTRCAVLVHACTLGVEVVHVLGPVLDGRVAQVRTLTHEKLDSAGVEVGYVVFGRGATLDEVQVGAVLHDDERVLKLAGALAR